MKPIELILKCIFLGTVQGLTEFLPVSSSGHLALLQRLLGYSLEDGSMTFLSIMLHFGTLIAVAVVFRREICALFHRPYKRLFMLAAATVPAGLAGLFLGGRVDALFAGPHGVLYIAAAFGVTAAMLLVCELAASKRKRARTLGWGQTAAMGLMQAVAIIPGISRSGSTIAAGVVSGGKVEEVSVFSFLMSIPVILGSVVLGAAGAVKDPAMLAGMGGAAGILGIALGVAAAAISGYFALKLMKKLMARANYKWFALYLLILSCLSLWLDLIV